jgi:NAD(P)H-hydrate epimerase
MGRCGHIDPERGHCYTQAMKLVTATEMRQLEQTAVDEGVSLLDLMRNAGQAVSAEIAGMFEPIAGKRVIVLVGRGNNGGDGLVAARHLKAAGALVDVYLLAERQSEDIVYREALVAGLTPIEGRMDVSFERLRAALSEADIILDAVFGIGLKRRIEGGIAAALALAAQAKSERPEMTVIALDVPSGLNADTGSVDKATLAADFTITLGCAKRGFFLFPGADYTGEILIADIGLPQGADDVIQTEVLDEHLVSALLPARPAGGHKGTFGKVLVVAGSAEYTGAAALACHAAYRAGAGLVTLAAPKSLHPIFAVKLTESTHLLLPETAAGELSPEAAAIIAGRLDSYDALALGPGLGQSPAAVEFIHQVLSAAPVTIKMVVDADALNALALDHDWWQKLDHPAVVTPHPGEFSRLTSLSVEAVQADRIGNASRYAELWQQTIVLKGAHSVIAAPDGRVAVAPNANPALATAGTGDVLAGVIAALLAQGLDEFDAARAGVYLHAMAAEAVKTNLGDSGMLASDLLIQIPRAAKALKEHDHAVCH